VSILAEVREKQGTGLKKEVAAALSYVLGAITGIVFLILEKDAFVRFHAMQSIAVTLVFFVASWLLGILGIVLGLTVVLAWIPALLGGLLWIGGFVLWLMLIYKAYQGEKWELPYIGKFVAKMV
jgi:uncharacterized membrane protein